jgi:2-phosphoglycerate kinase
LLNFKQAASTTDGSSLKTFSPPPKRDKEIVTIDNRLVIPKANLVQIICELLKKYSYYAGQSRNTPKLLQIAWDLKTNKKSFCILLGGTSGCGKSTLASLLATRLGVTNVLSSDNVRSLMRSFSSEAKSPILYSSSYSAYKQLLSENQGSSSSPVSDGIAASEVINGYEAQNKVLLDKLQSLLKVLQERRESVIIEGVHLSVDTILALMNSFCSQTIVLPFIVFISNSSKHAERFAIRAKYMTLEPRKNKYINHFNNIRVIQTHLCDLADKHFIPKIDNTNVDRSLLFVQETMLNYLYEGASKTTVEDQLKQLTECFAQTVDKFGLKSKEMIKLLHSKGSVRPRSNTVPARNGYQENSNLDGPFEQELVEILLSLNTDIHALGSLDS